jgi:hypothetical protein
MITPPHQYLLELLTNIVVLCAPETIARKKIDKLFTITTPIPKKLNG